MVRWRYITLPLLPKTTALLVPNVIVGNSTFSLRNYLLRPYSGQNLPGMNLLVVGIHDVIM